MTSFGIHPERLPQDKTVRIAVLLTCFNRKQKTLACIAALTTCQLPAGVDLSVFLVDDGSRDGTADAVGSAFPQVKIMSGDGSLYWNGGMRRAFQAAMDQGGFDYYLWLNDDTLLDRSAIEQILECQQVVSTQSGVFSNIIVGSTRDPVSGLLTYGGLVARDAASPNQLVNMPVSSVPQRCRTINGNCVLIAAEVAARLGNLDKNFVHAIGDWDYGLRATAAGFGVWVAPGFVGTCERNPALVLKPEVVRSIRARLRHICSAKQVPPRAWYVYVRRNYGLTWPLEFCKPYASAIIGALRVKFFDRGNKAKQ